MHPFTINGRSYSIDRALQELPKMDLIEWLESFPLYPKVFWKELGSNVTRAAVGNLLLFPEVPQITPALPFDVRFYGGIRFRENHLYDDTWKGFPNTCFWLPLIEVTQEETQTQAVSYSVTGPASTESFPNSFSSQNTSATFLEKTHLPCKDNWQKNVEAALHAIASGKLEKLVTARKTSLQFSGPLSPWPILAHLRDKAKRATLFAFQLSPTLCFLGATPEKLFHREDNLFNADALAGTRPRGKTSKEDLQLEDELRSSLKEQNEFKIVKDYLDAALLPLSEKMRWEEIDGVIKTSHVQHLHNRLSATLKSTISDLDLIRALHPTPALGGYPREKAMQLLKEMEPFDRGWYGAPVGVIGNQSSTLYVAIRSALIKEHTMHLFAGTGIVPGSTADREWEELEHKIRPLAELFN